MMVALAALLLSAVSSLGDDVGLLKADRAACEENEGSCSGEAYAQLLLNLGDALRAEYTATVPEDVIMSEDTGFEAVVEAYEQCAKSSFDALGRESKLHNLAVMRLGEAQMDRGKYQEAHKLFSGWLKGLDESLAGSEPDDQQRAARVWAVAKIGEAAALGGQITLAVKMLKQALELQRELAALVKQRAGRYASLYARYLDEDEDGPSPPSPPGMAAGAGGLTSAREARVHMLLVMALSGGSENGSEAVAAAEHAARCVALHTPNGTASGADITAERAADELPSLVEAAMCAALRTTALNAAAEEESLVPESMVAAMEEAQADAEARQREAVALLGVDDPAEDDVGAATALYKFFIARLRSEGQTRAAAQHVAAFLGKPAFEWVGMPAHPAEEAGEAPGFAEAEQAMKDEV